MSKPTDVEENNPPGETTSLLPETRDSLDLQHKLERLMLIPRIKDISITKFSKIFLECAALPIFFVLTFSAMAFGEKITIWSRKYQSYNIPLVYSIIGIILFCYLFDAQRWKSRFGKNLRTLLLSTLFLAVSLMSIFVSVDHPYFSLCTFTVLLPVWLYACRYIFFRRKSREVYVSWLSGPLFVTGLIVIAIWVYWTTRDRMNQWNPKTKIIYSEESQCIPDFSSYPECLNSTTNQSCFSIEVKNGIRDISYEKGCDEKCAAVYDECFHSFVLWAWPLVAGTSLIFLSFASAFLIPEEEEIGKSLKPSSFIKMWIMLLFGMWVAACVSGVGARLTESLIFFVFSLVLSGILLVIGAMNLQETTQQAQEKVTESYDDFLDMMESLVILFAPIPLTIYLALSFLNQGVRKVMVFRSSSRTEVKGCFTDVTSNQINGMKSWNWVKVIKNSIFCGAVYLTLFVFIGQFTNVFLSWLIESTKDMTLTVVTILMFIVGIMLFLLPPVPGFPIYLTSGIILVNSGLPQLGLMGSICYTISFALLLKISACTIQQKIIGERMCDSISVRQMVGINSQPMRAAKLVLSEPKFSVGKIMCLVGLPDWPTSVLCGVMRLDLIPVILATLPVVIVIVPVVLTGTFIYLDSLPEQDEAYPWAATALGVCVSTSAVIQVATLTSATYIVERTMSERKLEVDGLELDTEVEEADEYLNSETQSFYEINSWDKLSRGSKSLLIMALFSMILSVHTVLLFESRCFVEYELTYTITEHLGGNVLNFLKPLGWVAIISFCLSYMCMFAFNHGAKVGVVAGTKSGSQPKKVRFVSIRESFLKRQESMFVSEF